MQARGIMNMGFDQPVERHQRMTTLRSCWPTRDTATTPTSATASQMAEYGWVAPKGRMWMASLREVIDSDNSLPVAARDMLRVMLVMLDGLDFQIADLDKEIARRAREDEDVRRLMTIPGIGPIAATAICALAPPAETFARGRDFAAWVGLTPLQKSTGGKPRQGRTTKMGERTLRRLPIVVFTQAAECVDCYSSMGTWLASQSPTVQKLTDLGIRVVILGHDRSPMCHNNLPKIVDRRFVVGGLLLNTLVFRKVMQTYFGTHVPNDARHGLRVGVCPTWLREHVNHPEN